MPRKLVPRLGIVLAGAALVATAAFACTDDGSAAADGGSIAGMLSLVPDTEANRKFVLISLYEKAEKTADLKPQGAKGRQRELRRIIRLTSDPETGTGVAGGELAAGPRLARPDVGAGADGGGQYGALGYVPSDVTAEVAAGQPPNQVAIATGELDADEILDKAAEIEGSTRKEVDGTEVVRWLDDLAVDRELETPIGRIPGQAGRIAVPADGVLTYARTDAISESVNATVAGDRGSLADNDDLVPVAERLDDLDAHSAYLSTEPLRSRGPTRSPDQEGNGAEGAGTALARYDAVGVGTALKDKKPSMVVVLVHGSDQAAQLNTERLEANVADGKSFVTRRPWSDLLTEGDIEQDGRMVVATFRVERSDLWYRLVFQGDNLLAVS